MDLYTRIPIWENSRRLDALAKFHTLAITYFNHSQQDSISQFLTENVDARQARQKINFVREDIRKIIVAAGVSPYVHTQLTGDFDIIVGMFNIPRSFVSPQLVFDCLERTIGVYQGDRPNALIRTFNPLWWIYLGLINLVRIHFVVLNAIGINTAAFEGGVLGKLSKLIPVVASSVVLLHFMGWLDDVKAALGIP